MVDDFTQFLFFHPMVVWGLLGWRVMMNGHRSYSYLLSCGNAVATHAVTDLLTLLSSFVFFFTYASSMALGDSNVVLLGCLLIHHFGPQKSISSTPGCISIRFDTVIQWLVPLPHRRRVGVRTWRLAGDFFCVGFLGMHLPQSTGMRISLIAYSSLAVSVNRSVNDSFNSQLMDQDWNLLISPWDLHLCCWLKRLNNFWIDSDEICRSQSFPHEEDELCYPSSLLTN